MKRLTETRQFYRYHLRKQDINKNKENIRNLMLCLSSNNENCCKICNNKWVIEEQNQNIVSLIIQVFNEQFVCPAHIELVFSKILEILLKQPHYYHKIIVKRKENSPNLYCRKVILLFEIFDNQLLLSNNQLQDCITQSFQQQQQFIYQLFDTAYGLNERGLESGQSFTDSFDIKRISFNTILFIFQKYPLLFQDLLQQYPLFWMLRAANDHKLLELYQLLCNICIQSFQNHQPYGRMLPFIEQSIRQQISDIKTISLQKQLEKQLLLLIQYLFQADSISNVLTVQQIASLCLFKCNSHHKQVSRITQHLFYYYQQKCNEYQQSLLSQPLQQLAQALALKEQKQRNIDIQIL